MYHFINNFILMVGMVAIHFAIPGKDKPETGINEVEAQ